MEEPLFSDREEARIKELLHETLTEFFAQKGVTMKSILVTSATVAGSLLVILTFMKTVLGYFGFHYLSK